MALSQSELADHLGMSLRQIQNIEAGTGDLRRVHALAMERITLAFAVASGKWGTALPSIREDVLKAFSLLSGKETASHDDL